MKARKHIHHIQKTIVIGLCLAIAPAAWSQTTTLTLEQAVQQGLASNKTVQSAQYDVEAKQSLRKTAGDIGRFTAVGMIGQYNSYEKADNNITVSQTIPFPTVFAARAALGDANIKSSELTLAATQNEIAYQVKSTWYHLAYLHALNTWYTRTDSLWKAFAQAAALRQRTGETNLLEKVTAESRYLQAQTQLHQNQRDIDIYKQRLQTVLHSAAGVDVESIKLTARPRPAADTAAGPENPRIGWYRQQVAVASKERAVEKSGLAPELILGYFNQTLIGTPRAEGTTALATKSDRYQGFEVGVSFPLWFKPQVARVRAAEYTRLTAQTRYEQELRNYSGEVSVLNQEVDKLYTSLTYYESSALPRAELILKQANLALRGGEIGYLELIQAVSTAAELQVGYLETLNNYNQAVVRLELLLGQR
ncbi:TolC family protein [Dawidia soli]|uniref:TolC family protein n=1 Tax=Dawidia soli TaxID=2782352 RepID=A0AAP2GFB5_9BACT|nr:TolC family protein [Dawidia soli]MBT1684966.1 TolC family protein [Dawidia soli]